MAAGPVAPPLPSLRPFVVGDAALLPAEEGARFQLTSASAARYSDAQWDDFHGRARVDFLWRPPLRLALEARFSHPASALRGTAGFGWWNAPFAGERATEVAAPPQALWFFVASPPNALNTQPGWSGHGAFVQVLNVPALPRWLMAVGQAALRLPPLGWLARHGAGAVSRAAERPLPALELRAWHRYSLEWRRDAATFWVDGQCVLRAAAPPAGPLALVIWMDNQWGTLDGRGGLLEVPDRQWMELRALSLTPLA